MKIKININYIWGLLTLIMFSPLTDFIYNSKLQGTKLIMSTRIYNILEEISSLISSSRLLFTLLTVLIFIGPLILKRKNIIKELPYTVTMLLILFFVFITSYINNIEISYIISRIVGIFSICIVYEIAITKDKKAATDSIAHFLIISLFFNLIFMLMYKDGVYIDSNMTRYNLLGMDNQISPIILISMFLSNLLFNDKNYKKMSAILLFLSIINSILIWSATCIVCVSLLVLYRLFFSKQKTRNIISNKNIIRLYVFLMILFIFFNCNSILVQFAESIFGKGDNVASRIKIWNATIEQIKLHPIIGYGLGHKVYGNYYSHNGLLELLVIGGVGTFIFYTDLIRKILKKINEKNEYYSSLAIIGVLSILLLNTTEAFVFNIYQILFMLILFYINCFKGEIKNEKKSRNFNTVIV